MAREVTDICLQVLKENKESGFVSSQAAQTWYVSLNEYINIHMDKLLRWVVETPMDWNSVKVKI